MNIKDELTKGKGYAIVSIEDIENFKKLRDIFIKIMTSNKSNKISTDINFIRAKVAKMTKAEVNKHMVKLLKFTNLSEMIINSFPRLIQNLCGNELFIQRRATIVMNVPGKGHAKQWPHYELMSGISPFTFVIWAPLHDLETNSGVYYIEEKESIKIMKEEHKKGLVNGPTVLNMMRNKRTQPLKFGQAVIFNPFIIHGNIEFESELARIAYNVRFQSYNMPLLQKNTDYLKYHKLN